MSCGSPRGRLTADGPGCFGRGHGSAATNTPEATKAPEPTNTPEPTNAPEPTSVTFIGNDAFASSGLTSVTIPGSVTSISDWTFYSCGQLASVTISSGVTSIGDMAFTECFNLNSVTIPAGVTSIGYAAFAECGLTDVTYGGSAAQWGQISIGEYNDPLLSAAIHYNG